MTPSLLTKRTRVPLVHSTDKSPNPHQCALHLLKDCLPKWSPGVEPGAETRYNNLFTYEAYNQLLWNAICEVRVSPIPWQTGKLAPSPKNITKRCCAMSDKQLQGLFVISLMTHCEHNGFPSQMTSIQQHTTSSGTMSPDCWWTTRLH
jgi:hypothetical protein